MTVRLLGFTVAGGTGTTRAAAVMVWPMTAGDDLARSLRKTGRQETPNAHLQIVRPAMRVGHPKPRTPLAGVGSSGEGIVKSYGWSVL
jgi:hypothetical protein